VEPLCCPHGLRLQQLRVDRSDLPVVERAGRGGVYG
jgi:hypothetical protein